MNQTSGKYSMCQFNIQNLLYDFLKITFHIHFDVMLYLRDLSKKFSENSINI